MPIPPINPVKNLFVLFEFFIFKACKDQSIAIGIKSIITTYILIYILKNSSIIDIINAIKMPVHLAHIGI